MQSIGLSYAALDFENTMPYTNFQSDDERGSVLKIFSSYTLRDQDSAFFDPVYVESEPSHDHSHWNSLASNTTDTFFPCDAILLPPSYSLTDGSHLNDIQDDAPLWSWGASSSSSSAGSPVIPANGQMPFIQDLIPPPPTYFSFDNAPPSPLELNEFSNVFDFDFSTSHNYPTSEPRSSTLPTPLSRKRASRNSPPRSPRNVHSPESDISREPSPVNSDSNSKRRFPCQIPGCSRRFTSQYTLKVHMEAHKPKPRVSFPCTLGCSERFSRQHDRLRHEVAKHGKVCEFLCDDCGRFFSSSKTLGNHKCPVPQGGTRWVNN